MKKGIIGRKAAGGCRKDGWSCWYLDFVLCRHLVLRVSFNNVMFQ